MLNFDRPGELLDTHPAVANYCLNVLSDRQFVTMYQLEHPDYETEEEYGLLLEAWKAHRVEWTRQAKEEGRDEYLPKPKRRPGRPVNQKALEERRQAEAERQAHREEKKRRAEEKEAAKLARAQRNSGSVVLTLRLPDNIVGAIAQIRGDLPIADCVVQLLEHALGPLVVKK